MRTILILGCGNMGGAMLAGWLASDLSLKLTVVDPAVTEVPADVRLLRQAPAERFDIVLLGIKPQLLGAVAPALAPVMTASTVLLSILAGAELASLAGHFPINGGIVRVMPNLAAAIGKSPIGLFGERLTDPVRAAVTALLDPLGTPEWLAREADLDAVTAGSTTVSFSDKSEASHPASIAPPILPQPRMRIVRMKPLSNCG